MNVCPICCAKISQTRLMCYRHWDMVPTGQQDQVVALLDASLRGRTSSIRHLAMEKYRKAREAAIATVEASLA